jgi:predicted dehydrogenase
MRPAAAKAIARPRVGFAGVGWIGRNRLEAVASLGQITVAAIADPVEANREAALKVAPNATETESFEALLELDLDGLVIATPSGQHAQQAAAALDAGLAVFCQKPVGRNAREVSAVVEAARRADRLLDADLCYRRTAAFQALHALAIGGELGELYAARFVFHNAYGPDKPWFYDPVLSGGGCLIDLGTHLIDLALWLMPDEWVTGVECQAFDKGGRLGEGGVEDFASAQLTLSNGAAVELACSWRVHAGTEAVIEADLFGTNGGASVRNVSGSFYDFIAHRHAGTRTHLLCAPPDDWSGRAIGAWADRLATGAHFDPQCESLVCLSEVLDGLYARCRR